MVQKKAILVPQDSISTVYEKSQRAFFNSLLDASPLSTIAAPNQECEHGNSKQVGQHNTKLCLAAAGGKPIQTGHGGS